MYPPAALQSHTNMASEAATSSQQSAINIIYVKSEFSENTGENNAFRELFDTKLANFYNEQVGRYY